MFNEDQTAKMLPPEFVLLGNSRPDPWHPVDSLATMRLIFLHLSFSWTTDYLRDLLSSLENGELRSIADELAPFRAEHTIDLMTILDDDDMKADGLYDEKTIMEKFNAVKSQREKEQSDLKVKQKQ
jgi:acyl-homoserine lactone acylase PvdQ